MRIMKNAYVAFVLSFALHPFAAFAQESETLQAQCEDGNAETCSILAMTYLEGTAARQTAENIAAQYTAACDDGIRFACTFAVPSSGNFFTGMFDPLSAIYFERACILGHGESCNDIGTFFQSGLVVEQDGEQAQIRMMRACMTTSQYGCLNFGDMLRDGSNPEEMISVALPIFIYGCEIGSGSGCANAAAIYHQGLGVEESVALAGDLYRLGCEGDDANACFIYGTWVRDGLFGLTENTGNSSELLRQACRLGHADACAYIVTTGQTETEIQNLSIFLAEACDDDSAPACAYHGQRLADGIGVKADLDQAREALMKSCTHISALGCSMLAQLYRDGVLRDLNRLQENMYTELACTLGSEEDCLLIGE